MTNNKRLEASARAYFDISSSLGLNDDMSLNEKVQLLLKEGLKCLQSLHEDEDSIITEDYDEVFNTLNIPLSKQQYKEFVTIMSKIRIDEFSDKNREKYEETVKQKVFDSYIREQFLDKVINQFDDNIPIPDLTKNISINVIGKDDDEFNEVLNQSIEKNIKILTIHKQLLNNLGLAFEYVTEGKYTSKDFKTLLDWKYFSGGVPNENSKSKLFDVFYKYMKAMRLGEDFEVKEINALLREMGMEIKLIEPLPQSDHYAWWERDVIERYCPSAVEDYRDWLKEKIR